MHCQSTIVKRKYQMSPSKVITKPQTPIFGAFLRTLPSIFHYFSRHLQGRVKSLYIFVFEHFMHLGRQE